MIQNVATFSTLEDYGALSDAEILARSQREPELFAVLVRRWETALLRRAKAVLRSPEDAEEVVQDAFMKMYLYADRYAPVKGASFSSWAYTVLNRVAYTKYRGRIREQEAVAHLEPEYLESFPDERAEFIEDLSIRNEVLAALSKLPETASRILRAQFVEGKTQEEIAQSENLSIPAVKTRVHRAKKLFKQAYDEQHTP